MRRERLNKTCFVLCIFLIILEFIKHNSAIFQPNFLLIESFIFSFADINYDCYWSLCPLMLLTNYIHDKTESSFPSLRVKLFNISKSIFYTYIFGNILITYKWFLMRYSYRAESADN